MSSPPLVSVLLPTFARNASGLLAKSIQSVLAQSVDDFELLVVDDGSTDGSAATISEFAKHDRRVRHIRFEQNVGLPAVTTAHAFLASKGRFIAWQFDDCEWYPHLLETLLAAATEHKKPSIFYGQIDMVMDSGRVVFGEKCDHASLAYRNSIPNVATLISREVIDSVGWLDPHILLKRICDYDLWLRASKEFDLVFINQPLAAEHGCVMADSLGNSVSLFSDLSYQYIRENRNAALNPASVIEADPFALPRFIDESEFDKFHYLVFEHLIRVGRPKDAVSRLSKYIDPSSGRKDFDAQLCRSIVWFNQRTRLFFEPIDPKFIGYQRYIINLVRAYGIKSVPIIIRSAARVLKRVFD